MEEKENDIDILNQSLEALNIIKEELQDNDEIFSDEVTDFNIDSILDKINASGFNSLTKKEVEFLEKRAK